MAWGAAAAVCLFADEAGLELALCYVFSWQQLARHSSFAEMKTISCAEAVSIHFLTGFQCGAAEAAAAPRRTAEQQQRRWPPHERH